MQGVEQGDKKMVDVKERENEKRKSIGDRLSKWTPFMILFVLLFSFAGFVFAVQDHCYKEPHLQVDKPFQDNETVCFRIHNDGNERALIKSITVCWFDSPNSSYCNTRGRVKRNNTITTICLSMNRKEYNPPKEILSDHSEDLKTALTISTLKKHYIHPVNERWGVEICETSLGCKVYEFYGVPKETISYGVSPPIRSEISMAEWDTYYHEINQSDYLNIYHSGGFSLHKNGNISSGTWTVEGDWMYLNFGDITISGKIEGNTITDPDGIRWIK